MKNKEWLKKKVIDFGNLPETYMSKTIVADVDMVNCLIDELEEPEQEKVMVNEMMAGHIENCKNLKLTLSDSLHLVVSGDKQEEALFARAWLDGYTVEKEPQWVVKTGKNWFFKNFESVGEYNYQAIGTGSIEEAKKFKDKLEAESVALLSDGEVEEITK